MIEDIDWLEFDHQPLPEPFATLHHTLRTAYTAGAGYDGEWGRRMLATMRAMGLVDVESKGKVDTMHGGTPSAEWYVMALERAVPRLGRGRPGRRGAGPRRGRSGPPARLRGALTAVDLGLGSQTGLMVGRIGSMQKKGYRLRMSPVRRILLAGLLDA